MKITRRQLLMNSSLWVAGSILMNPLTRALADSASPNGGPFLVYLCIENGVDVTLGLDPQIQRQGNDDKDVYLEYREDEILRAGNLKFAPGAKALIPFANDISIVNGISMIRDAGHDSNRRYLATGNGAGRLANYAVQFAENHHSPYGTLANNSVDTGQLVAPVTNLSSMGGTGDISSLADILGNEYRADIDLIGLKKPMTVKISEELKKQNPNFNDTVCTTAAYFAAGLASSASLSVTQLTPGGFLDTHSNHPKVHMEGQAKSWEMVAEIFKIFKSTPLGQGSLFDQTTFIVLSEFSRTPFLNSSNGKDHNPFTNSVLLAGRGIKGGTTVGQSYVWGRNQTAEKIALHTGLPINYNTGQAHFTKPDMSKEKIDMIIPENVARTVLQASGLTKIPTELSRFAALPNILK